MRHDVERRNRFPTRETRCHFPFQGIHDLVKFAQECSDLHEKGRRTLWKETVAGRAGGLSQGFSSAKSCASAWAAASTSAAAKTPETTAMPSAPASIT
jgi:hypothetical protein